MGLMQSGSNFTDRIVKYVAKRAERKTKPASPPMGHVIPQIRNNFIYIYTFVGTPNPSPTLNLPTYEQYKTRSRQIKVRSLVFIEKTDHKKAV